jgi:sulfate adenylyltransferase
MPDLIKPHGGVIHQFVPDVDLAAKLQEEASGLPSVHLNQRQMCDLELLMNGAFSPLRSFMTRKDYEGVVGEMRLADGTLWPIPITLDLGDEDARCIDPSGKLALRDGEGLPLAIMQVEDVWQPDKRREAKLVFGTESTEHPGVGYLMTTAGKHYVGGSLQGVRIPVHLDYGGLRRTPSETREEFQKRGWTRVVAFQTRDPIHRAHKEMTLRASREIGGNLLIHPVVGTTKDGDVDHHTRIRCYQMIQKRYPEGTALLSLLPLAMRVAGPREALWHGIIRKNYGCTHMIIGRDHAGPGKDSKGVPFYDPYTAQDLFRQHEAELEIRMIPFKEMVYLVDRGTYEPLDAVPKGAETRSVSATELRNRLLEEREVPDWFSYPEIVNELRRSYPPRTARGFTVFFSGLSGSGKSTIAKAVMARILEMGGRQITLLDGDIVRTHLSKGLGFSREGRNTNITRIAFVASEVTKHGGIAICAQIAPYAESRAAARDLIARAGGFIEVHLDTPLEVCEKRDVKGLYAKARKGLIKGFTGVDDPYERPESPELRINTADVEIDQSADLIMDHLYRAGYLKR